MFIDAFNKCSSDEAASFLALLHTHWRDHGFHADGLMLLKKSLSFFPDAFYYDLTQADQHPSRIAHVVVGPRAEQILVCDGTKESIQKYNQFYPLNLDRALVLDYVRFYFAHVTGPHGLSTIIDTVEDLQMKEEPTPALRKALHDKIVPLTLNASLGGGGYQARGTLLVEQTLFSTFIDVQMDGRVGVELGRVLADLLPVHHRALEG